MLRRATWPRPNTIQVLMQSDSFYNFTIAPSMHSDSNLNTNSIAHLLPLRCETAIMHGQCTFGMTVDYMQRSMRQCKHKLSQCGPIPTRSTRAFPTEGSIALRQPNLNRRMHNDSQSLATWGRSMQQALPFGCMLFLFSETKRENATLKYKLLTWPHH